MEWEELRTTTRKQRVGGGRKRQGEEKTSESQSFSFSGLPGPSKEANSSRGKWNRLEYQYECTHTNTLRTEVTRYQNRLMKEERATTKKEKEGI